MPAAAPLRLVHRAPQRPLEFAPTPAPDRISDRAFVALILGTCAALWLIAIAVFLWWLAS
jgi:hypothetical protein